jgi:hypothetical protein
MALPIEEVLAQWREAERNRDALPTGHPQRKVMEARILHLRRRYRDLTKAIEASDELLRLADDQTASTMETLRRARSRAPDDDRG